MEHKKADQYTKEDVKKWRELCEEIINSTDQRGNNKNHNIMKKIIAQIKKSWFWKLSFLQKLNVIYFIISFCTIGSLADGPWWGVLLIAGNFALSALLIKQVPLED